jgi:Acetyl-CoA hydrolase/transferase C-terminal domain
MDLGPDPPCRRSAGRVKRLGLTEHLQAPRGQYRSPGRLLRNPLGPAHIGSMAVDVASTSPVVTVISRIHSDSRWSVAGWPCTPMFATCAPGRTRLVHSSKLAGTLSPPARQITDVHESIGERVAALVPDAATLQLGIGGVPDAVLGQLRRRRGLGVWLEMFIDGVLRLERAGGLAADRPITASFAFGSAELYAWLERNPRVRMLGTEKTNAPGLIARQAAMVSVNGALQVDQASRAPRPSGATTPAPRQSRS